VIDHQNKQGTHKTNFPTLNDPMKKWEKGLNREFSKEEVQRAKKHIKK
jgi:hypothetical protein